MDSSPGFVAPTRTGTPPRAVVSWSSGKDSYFALHEVLRFGSANVVGLLTTVTEPYGRVSMHGVRTEILDLQAKELHLPVTKVMIPAPCPNSVYERQMAEALRVLRASGVSQVIFGDLFLEDIRAYREDLMKDSGLTPVFPLWKRDTRTLAGEMISSGMRAIVVCLDPRKVPATFAGRVYDETMLADLPASVDPCGENGEFHTCVIGGPMFRHPLSVRLGEVVEREGFVFADVFR